MVVIRKLKAIIIIIFNHSYYDYCSLVFILLIDYIAIFTVHYSTSCNTQYSAPEDGCDHRPKHVELIGIINKPLLLHLVGVYIIYISDTRSNKYQIYKDVRHT